MIERIFQLARQHEGTIRSIRRDLHAHPETGQDLPRTRSIVARTLQTLGVHIREIAGGIVADIQPLHAGPTVALRADMDALNMSEKTTLPFASTVQGKAHMCGHDAHTAILLGTAMVLTEMQESLPGPVRFIFQPNEETQPGGAQAMIEAGCLEGVDEIFGLHVWPDGPVGWIGTRIGPIMARPDAFTITLRGQGGHASTPDKCVDPILAGCQLVASLQTIIPTKVSALDPAVLTVTRFQAGTAFNIIPDLVELEGTVRSLDNAVGNAIEQQMSAHVRALEAMTGVHGTLDYKHGYPVVDNHEKSTRKALRVLKDITPDIDGAIRPHMGGEDFSRYLQVVPGCFFYLGCSPGTGSSHGLHNARFILDECCLPLGVAALSALALDQSGQDFS